jgi:hypothetical protein
VVAVATAVKGLSPSGVFIGHAQDPPLVDTEWTTARCLVIVVPATQTGADAIANHAGKSFWFEPAINHLGVSREKSRPRIGQVKAQVESAERSRTFEQPAHRCGSSQNSSGLFHDRTPPL